MQKDKKKVLIVGSDSKIGKACARNLAFNNCEIWGTSRKRKDASKNIFLDLTKPSLFSISSLPSVDYVLWTAAITDISTCETQPKHTWEINVENTWRIIKEICNSKNKLIYFSTSEVFDGLQPKVPRFAQQNPKSQYGCQKSEIEKRIKEFSEDYIIIRLTKVISEEFALLDEWCEKLLSKQVIRPYYDLFMSPISLDSVVQLIENLIKNDSVEEKTIQLSGNEDISFAKFAVHLADTLGVSQELVKPCSAYGIVDSERINKFNSLENTYPIHNFGKKDLDVIQWFVKNIELRIQSKNSSKTNAE